jgi:hypothetical protein
MRMGALGAEFGRGGRAARCRGAGSVLAGGVRRSCTVAGAALLVRLGDRSDAVERHSLGRATPQSPTAARSRRARRSAGARGRIRGDLQPAPGGLRRPRLPPRGASGGGLRSAAFSPVAASPSPALVPRSGSCVVHARRGRSRPVSGRWVRCSRSCCSVCTARTSVGHIWF